MTAPLTGVLMAEVAPSMEGDSRVRTGRARLYRREGLRQLELGEHEVSLEAGEMVKKYQLLKVEAGKNGYHATIEEKT